MGKFIRVVHKITVKNPFGYSSYGHARRARAARHGFSIWFHHRSGWYLKRGNTAYGRAGATKPLSEVRG